MEKLELTTEDCAFVYYVLRDWSQKHENYDEQDVDKVYQIAKNLKLTNYEIKLTIST